METQTIIAIVGGLFGILVSGGGIITFWTTFSNNIKDAKSAADAAKAQAATAIARVITLEIALTNLRVEVARDYVSQPKLDTMEKRVVDAINRLGERVDHAFANKGH
jgi:flagellar basal body-associated protein FliL